MREPTGNKCIEFRKRFHVRVEVPVKESFFFAAASRERIMKRVGPARRWETENFRMGGLEQKDGHKMQMN